MKVLVYSDAPVCITGFGTVCRNIFTPLHKSGMFSDLWFWGVNYHGQPHNAPFKIWPASVNDADPYGRARFAANVLNNAWPDPDVIFFLLDHFSLSYSIQFPDGGIDQFVPGLIRRMKAKGSRTSFVQYIPVDGETVRPEWVHWTAELVNFPVAYCEWGAAVLKNVVPSIARKLRVIPHGTSPDTFFPIDANVRENYRSQPGGFGLSPGQPLVINVNRNQPRKDIPKTLLVFREVLREIPEARLYLHMNPVDPAGFHLELVRQHLRIPKHAVLFPSNFSEGYGVDLELLNVIYNAADCFLSTANGEGWGLIVSDSMTAGCPVVAGNHSSYRELLGDGRGVLVDPEDFPSFSTMDNDQPRPVVSPKKMANAVVALLRDPARAAEIRTKAREWALSISWKDHVAPLWESVFRESAAKSQPTPKIPLALNSSA